MRLALGSISRIDDQILSFARQLGATDIVVSRIDQIVA